GRQPVVLEPDKVRPRRPRARQQRPKRQQAVERPWFARGIGVCEPLLARGGSVRFRGARHGGRHSGMSSAEGERLLLHRGPVNAELGDLGRMLWTLC
ncbi:MAG: hypothetical protein K0R61_4624, partial [Microvirga sp.]|nr:hypothetical protein [Microvirga sp.]